MRSKTCPRLVLAALALGIVVGPPAGPLSAAEERIDVAGNFQIDAAHDGRASVPKLTLPLERLWSVPATIPSYPIIAQDLVIVTTGTGGPDGAAIRAFDAMTGEERWSRPAAGGFGRAMAAYDAGRIFALEDTSLMALDAETGEQIWAAEADGFGAPPTTAFGAVFVATANETLAFAQDDGRLLWRAPGGSASGAPAVGRGLVVTVSGCLVTTATHTSGEGAWVHTTDCYGGGGQTGAIVGGRIYTRDHARTAVLDLESGSFQGTFVTDGPPAFDDTRIFSLSEGGLVATNLDTGLTEWRTNATLMLVSAPIVVGDWVISASTDGHVYAFAASDGEILWTGRVPGSVSGPDEHTLGAPLSGLGGAGPLVVVPSTERVTAFRAGGAWTISGVPPTSTIPEAETSSLAIWFLLGVAIVGGGVVGIVRRRKQRTPTAMNDPPPRPDFAAGS